MIREFDIQVIKCLQETPIEDIRWYRGGVPLTVNLPKKENLEGMSTLEIIERYLLGGSK